jgi:two-component system phosphate regulon response regulator OmpR
VPQDTKPRLVVVDDEPGIRAMIADYLARDGYPICRCGGGAELDAIVRTGAPDLVILDVTMPGEDGISIARRLRASAPGTRILMLTGLCDVVDKVVGLEVGADDYLTKPFDLRELRSRVRALLRRAQPASPAPCAATDCVPFGRVALDLDAHCLVDGDGDRQRLTASEFDLLQVFARNPNRVLSRDRLLDGAGTRNDPFDRAIDIRVTRIRRKVEVDPTKPQVIRTVRGAGYIYVPPPA